MRVLIAGVDGYLGWPLALHLARRGHVVAGIDGFLRRAWVAEIGSQSALPIRSMAERCHAFRENFGAELTFYEGDLCDYDTVVRALVDFQPDAVVHLAEMPSAPYSMIDVHHAVFAHHNNLTGTLHLLFALRDLAPQTHLVKLGTMGEYGTPNIDIPEGFFEIEFRGRKERLPFPCQPPSMYHLTKVHDSNNVRFACRVWGLKSTDIMQGVVFGTRIDAMGADARLCTRFDVDQSFGTAINRFCAQAVAGLPLTPFGRGGQKRGFLPLRDSIQCFTLALENPPAKSGEYRVLNQFADTLTINAVAEKVAGVARRLGLNPRISPVENPRRESEDHYYNPDHANLQALGYKPTRDLEGEIAVALADLAPHVERIRFVQDAVAPDIRWDGTRRRSRAVEDIPRPILRGPSSLGALGMPQVLHDKY
jgi:UDP-sulfoquinovose synthase